MVDAKERNTMKVWGVHLSGANFVSVQALEGRLFAACHGEIFCLEAATGRVLWQNGLKGFGFGLATLAVEPNCGSAAQTSVAEQAFEDQRAAATVATH